jgi:hypothetical protein
MRSKNGRKVRKEQKQTREELKQRKNRNKGMEWTVTGKKEE